MGVDLLQPIEVVKVRKGREELVCTTHPVRVSNYIFALEEQVVCSLETNDDPPLPAFLDLEHFNDGSASPFDFIHDLLVNVDSVI